MSHTREEVLELLADKRLTAQEADRLLAAIDHQSAARSWFLDPLTRLSSGVALSVGLLPIAAQLGLERLGLHFDGALDLHANGAPGTWAQALVNAAVGSPLLTAALLWGTTLAGRRPARLRDVVAAVGLSRWPLVLAGLCLLPLATAAREHADRLTLAGYAGLAASLPLLAWSTLLLISGFRTASGSRGARLGWSLAAALIVAEVLSKGIVHLVR